MNEHEESDCTIETCTMDPCPMKTKSKDDQPVKCPACQYMQRHIIIETLELV